MAPVNDTPLTKTVAELNCYTLSLLSAWLCTSQRAAALSIVKAAIKSGNGDSYGIEKKAKETHNSIAFLMEHALLKQHLFQCIHTGKLLM